MSIRDRGLKKWTPFMMPEHVGMVNRWKDEHHEKKRPELSEWELEDMQIKIEAALHEQSTIHLDVWSHEREYTITGKATCITFLNNQAILFLISAEDDTMTRIPLQDVYGIEKVDGHPC